MHKELYYAYRRIAAIRKVTAGTAFSVAEAKVGDVLSNPTSKILDLLLFCWERGSEELLFID